MILNIFYLTCQYIWCVSAQSCLTLCNPTDCSLPGSSVHGIFQARILGQGFLPGNLPNPGIELESPMFSALPGRFFITEPPGKHLLVNNDYLFLLKSLCHKPLVIHGEKNVWWYPYTWNKICNICLVLILKGLGFLEQIALENVSCAGKLTVPDSKRVDSASIFEVIDLRLVFYIVAWFTCAVAHS